VFAIPIGVFALEMGLLYYAGLRRNGRLSLEGVVLYREHMSLVQYVILGLLLFGWVLFVYAAIAEATSSFLESTLFSWMPSFLYAEVAYSHLPLWTVLVIAIVYVVVYTGAGILEELYFRGYLMPRISRFGWWAPVISTALFAVYHLDVPWAIPSVFVSFLPIALVTFWKKNLYLALILHAVANMLSYTVMFMPYFVK
jgi:membrane protease YdiL (CAAX protease family)